MADQLSVSLGYAQGTGVTHWPKATVKGTATIVAVCEVVDRQANTSLPALSVVAIFFVSHPPFTVLFSAGMPARLLLECVCLLVCSSKAALSGDTTRKEVKTRSLMVLAGVCVD